ncbi:hypothetical protein GCM10009111_23310 [Colwellia asteriadis]|uniref:Gingipain domain-containing protein n=1 Tax=Colwellia asteriadis TaxID=517723 RepID=A0ABP3WKW2_9GAMM
MNKLFNYNILILLLSLTLISCGGGSETDNSPDDISNQVILDSDGDGILDNDDAFPLNPERYLPNELPTVEIIKEDLDNNIIVLRTAVVDDYGDVSSYKWTQKTGSPLSLSDTDTSELTISYLDLKYDETFTFEVEITDHDKAVVNETLTLNLNAYKSIYIVTTDLIRNNLAAELAAFRTAIASDSQSDVSIISSPASALEIRTLLKNAFENSNLRGAIFIGDVPFVYNENTSSLSDHYYRALKCDYEETNQAHVKKAPRYYNLMENCHDSIWVSRILSHNTDSIVMIRDYLVKNVALRNNYEHFLPEMVRNEALGWETSRINEDKLDELLESYTSQHNIRVNRVNDVSAHEQKMNIINTLNSNYQLHKINVHGTPLLIAPQGSEKGDANYFYASSLQPSSTSPKVVEYESCSVGKFSEPNYLAAKTLFRGDTLLVSAFTSVVTISNTYDFEQRFTYNGLWLGKSFADMFLYNYMGTPGHYFGDPTIRLRQEPSSETRPNVILEDINYNEPFMHELTFNDVLEGESAELMLKIHNNGNGILNMTIKNATFTTVNGNRVPLAGMTGGFVFDFDDNDTSIGFTSTGYWDGTDDFSVTPNETVFIKLIFDPSFDNENLSEVDYSAIFKFMTNDPDTPIFKVRVKGSKVIN